MQAFVKRNISFSPPDISELDFRICGIGDGDEVLAV